MPQTTPERRARWPGHDSEAIAFLEAQGFTRVDASEKFGLLPGPWWWKAPTPDHLCSERERDAVVYLIEEWDFGECIECGCPIEAKRDSDTET